MIASPAARRHCTTLLITALCMAGCDGVLVGGPALDGGGDSGQVNDGPLEAARPDADPPKDGPPSLDLGPTDAPTSDKPVAADATPPDAALADASKKTCPASQPVNLKKWQPGSWTAPSTGTAEIYFPLSNEKYKHYQSLTMDFDVDVKAISGEYNCFAELKNKNVPKSWPSDFRTFTICTRNYPNKLLIFIVYMKKMLYKTVKFAMKPNTTYHFSVKYDAKAGTSSLSAAPKGGATTTVQAAPINSSIVPVGSGLNLQIGFNIGHKDYPLIQPPWGWVFRNLTLTMIPGGPHGSEAPPCP